MRKTYLDNIRWITVVLVVIYHVIYMFNGSVTAGVIGPFSSVQYQDAYQYIVYPWFMILLFVVSGMSAKYYLNSHTDKEFKKSRTTKLLVPSTIGVLLFGWIMGYYNMAIGGAFETMASKTPAVVTFLIMDVSGTGVLWYIQLLWVFSMVTLLCRKISKGKLFELCGRANIIALVLLTVPVWASAQILNTPIVVVYRFGIYGFAYAVGYLIFSHDEVMDRLEKWWHVLSAAAVALMVVFVITFWGQPYAEHSVLDTFLCNAYAWIAVLAILAVMKKFGNFENSFTKWMAKESWGLYLFHYLPIAMTAWYLHIYAPNTPAVVVYLLTAVAAFGGGIAIFEIVKRIPFVRWCLCGIKAQRSKSEQDSKAEA